MGGREREQCCTAFDGRNELTVEIGSCPLGDSPGMNPCKINPLILIKVDDVHEFSTLLGFKLVRGIGQAVRAAPVRAGHGCTLFNGAQSVNLRELKAFVASVGRCLDSNPVAAPGEVRLGGRLLAATQISLSHALSDAPICAGKSRCSVYTVAELVRLVIEVRLTAVEVMGIGRGVAVKGIALSANGEHGAIRPKAELLCSKVAERG